jgi:hypothetical protein
MSFAVHTLITLVLLFAVVWLVLFGGFGAALARSRGSSTGHGFAWGAALGPIGWMAIWWRTRHHPIDTASEVLVERPKAAAAVETSVFDDGFTL